MDRCYTYNEIMEETYTNKIHQAKSALYGECNAGVSVTKKKGKMGTMDTCIKPEGIANIISIIRLEKDGYCITYNTRE